MTKTDQTGGTFSRRYGVSRTRLHQSYFLGGVLIVLGLGIFLIGRQVIPDAILIAIGHVVVGTAVIGNGFRQARDPKPRLLLDADGIWFHGWNTRAIPWEQVKDVTTSGSRMNTFICIEIRDPDRLIHIIPAADRQKFKSNRLVNLPKLFIPNHNIDASFKDLLSDLQAGIEHYGN